MPPKNPGAQNFLKHHLEKQNIIPSLVPFTAVSNDSGTPTASSLDLDQQPMLPSQSSRPK
jgi:hypothetical protein